MVPGEDWSFKGLLESVRDWEEIFNSVMQEGEGDDVVLPIILGELVELEVVALVEWQFFLGKVEVVFKSMAV